MEITSIILTPEQISGNATGTGILLQVIPVYAFVNGKKTDEKQSEDNEILVTDNEIFDNYIEEFLILSTK